MDPALLSIANELLKSQGLRPRKRWGQNFLCNQSVLDRIVRAAALVSSDRTLEIGAGLGALTRSLAEYSSFVTSVEIDPLLLPILAKTLEGRENVKIIHADFLKLDHNALMDEAFGDEAGVVVANIPYYITTPLLEVFLTNKARIKRIVLLVQKEFGQRMVAKPATEEYGAMSVYAQFHSRVAICGSAPSNCFLPRPDVDSSIISLEPVVGGTVQVEDEALFFRIVRASFQQRRKTLSNTLCSPGTGWTREEAASVIQGAGIDAIRRGETLSLEEFALLTSIAIDLQRQEKLPVSTK
ncbi:MAG: 16S rRNA (adenine(1518)-N(6)/adenine(1519)-N(6))-dimethyltransferase RsmA [Chthonomonadales bacterium]